MAARLSGGGGFVIYLLAAAVLVSCWRLVVVVRCPSRRPTSRSFRRSLHHRLYGT